MEEIDPLEVVGSVVGESAAGRSPRHADRCNVVLDGLLPIKLTPAGIRALLGRKQREKPLLKIICKGCKRSTHDQDTFVHTDVLE